MSCREYCACLVCRTIYECELDVGQGDCIAACLTGFSFVSLSGLVGMLLARAANAVFITGMRLELNFKSNLFLSYGICSLYWTSAYEY